MRQEVVGVRAHRLDRRRAIQEADVAPDAVDHDRGDDEHHHGNRRRGLIDERDEREDEQGDNDGDDGEVDDPAFRASVANQPEMRDAGPSMEDDQRDRAANLGDGGKIKIMVSTMTTTVEIAVPKLP